MSEKSQETLEAAQTAIKDPALLKTVVDALADELLGRFAQEQESVRKLRCDALADDHGLTNREKDILYLLAQGRDLAFICETLFLSKNTVKSYQKTIYAKLDVHSKQEIIDLVHGKPDGPRR